MEYVGKKFVDFDQYVRWVYCCEEYGTQLKLLNSVRYLVVKQLMDSVVRKPSIEKLKLYICVAFEKLKPTNFSRTLLDDYVGERDFVGRIHDELFCANYGEPNNSAELVAENSTELNLNELKNSTELVAENLTELNLNESKNSVEPVADEFVEECRTQIQDLIFGIKLVHKYDGEIADVVVNTVNLSHIDGSVYVPIVANEKKTSLDSFAETLKLLTGKLVIVVVDADNENVIRGALNL